MKFFAYVCKNVKAYIFPTAVWAVETQLNVCTMWVVCTFYKSAAWRIDADARGNNIGIFMQKEFPKLLFTSTY